jgi:hypothetical protein
MSQVQPTFHDAIRQWREPLYTIRELARLIGMEENNYGRFERTGEWLTHEHAEAILALMPATQAAALRLLPDYPKPDIGERIAKLESTLGVPADKAMHFGEMAHFVMARKKLSANDLAGKPPINKKRHYWNGLPERDYIPEDEADNVARTLGFPNGVDRQFYEYAQVEQNIVDEREKKFNPAFYALWQYQQEPANRAGTKMRAVVRQGEIVTGAKDVDRQRHPTVKSNFSQSLFSDWRYRGGGPDGPQAEAIIEYLRTRQQPALAAAHRAGAFAGYTTAEQQAISGALQGPWSEDQFYKVGEALAAHIPHCHLTITVSPEQQQTKLFVDHFADILDAGQIPHHHFAAAMGVKNHLLQNMFRRRTQTVPAEVRDKIFTAMGMRVDNSPEQAEDNTAELHRLGGAAAHVLDIRHQAFDSQPGQDTRMYKYLTESRGLGKDNIRQILATTRDRQSELRAGEKTPGNMTLFAERVMDHRRDALRDGVNASLEQIHKQEPVDADREAISYTMGAILQRIPYGPAAEQRLYNEMGLNPDYGAFNAIQTFHQGFWDRNPEMYRQHQQHLPKPSRR